MHKKTVALLSGYSSFAMYFLRDDTKPFWGLSNTYRETRSSTFVIESILMGMQREFMRLGYSVEVNRWMDYTDDMPATSEFFITKVDICEATPLRGI